MRFAFPRLVGISLGACAAALAAAPAFAADSAPATTPEAGAPAPAQEIIVTGTPGGRGVNRLNAAFAVTNVSASDLIKAAPKSSAEVLNLVPGVWVESSGGVAGANITVRGLPSASDAPFVTYQLQGMPIYPAASLSFQENSSIFREDETIRAVEAVRGGPASVFSNAQAGLTVNHVLKEGGETTEGVVRATVTDYGTKRADALLSGKLADDLYYLVGGYVTTSPGIRSTQFDSEKGKQITVNITKKLDDGKISFYSRVTDDHGAWYLPFAVNVPGLDLGTYSQLGNYTRFAQIATGPGQTQTFDLAHGRGWNGSVSGVNFEKHFGQSWAVRAHIGYTKGDSDTYGLVPDGNAISAAKLAQSIGAASISTQHGSTLGANDYVQTWGAWIVQKRIEALTGDISVEKDIANQEIVLGYYGSSYSSDDYWSLGNGKPVQVTQNGDYLANVTCQQLAAAGSGSSCFAYAIQDAGTTHVNAGYLSDTWHITDALKFDASGRVEKDRTRFLLYTNTGSNPYPNLAAPTQTVDDSRTHFSWSTGLDYRVQPGIGVFGRVTRGWFNPVFDDFRNAGSKYAATAKLTAFEIGLKLQGAGYSLYATGFHNKYRGANAGDVLSANLESDDVNATGVELDGHVSIWRGLSLGGNATYQKSKIVGSNTPATLGNEFQRQPRVQLHLSPNYETKIGNASLNLFGTYAVVGRRFADDTNAVVLPAYAKVDLGGTVKLSGIELSAFVDNLTNSHGLTEGDPRSTTSANARPIFGRSFKFSLGYKF